MSDSAASERELRQRFAAGDREALGLLAERYQDALYRYLYRKIGNAEDAKDLVQETWHRALLKCELYQPSRAFRPWLFRVAKRLAINQWRRGRMRGRVQPLRDDPPEDAEPLTENALSPLAELIRKEDGHRLVEMIEQLPPDERRVVTLALAGKRQKEISNDLHRPPGTVSRWLSHARAQLADWLTDVNQR